MEIISLNNKRVMLDLVLEEVNVLSAALLLTYHRLNEEAADKLEAPLKKLIKGFLDEPNDVEYKRLFGELNSLAKTMRAYDIPE